MRTGVPVRDREAGVMPALPRNCEGGTSVASVPLGVRWMPGVREGGLARTIPEPGDLPRTQSQERPSEGEGG
jgi:hypothetical protein